MSTFESLANPWVGNLPTYEPGRPIEEVARELGFASVEDVTKLASNENALGPSPRAVEAMMAQAPLMHRYPDGGCYYLKRRLAQALDVMPGHILPGNGSNELLEFLGHVFLREGAGIVMAEQAFVVYKLIAAAARADVVTVPMRDFAHDLDAMADAITAQTRIVFVSNPNNPTGTLVDGVSIDRFMARVPDHVIVCFDEAYIELVDPELQPDTLRYVREGRRVIVLRTFSKTYGLAGLRIGYAVAPEACVSLLNKVRQPFNVNAMGLAAALAALEDVDHVRRTRDMVASGLSFLESRFAVMGLETVPSVANFMLVKVGHGREAFGQLQKRGVVVRPMDVYGLPDYVRVTVGTDAENERLVCALSDVRSCSPGVDV